MAPSRTQHHKLSAALLIGTLAIASLLSTAQANHATAHESFQHSPEFLAHHGAMQPKAASEQPPKLGVAISALSATELERMSLEYGVRVAKVIEGSIAEAAGVRTGDIITDLSGRPAYSPERLQHLVGKVEGDAVVSVRRDGQAVELSATFTKPTLSGKPMLGVRIQAMTNDLKEAFGATDDRGVLISQVKKGSGAALAGLKAGDVIVAIGGKAVTSVSDIYAAVNGQSPGDSLSLTYLRDRQQQQTEASLSAIASSAHPHAAGHNGTSKHGKHGSRFHGSYGKHPHHGCQAWQGQRRS